MSRFGFFAFINWFLLPFVAIVVACYLPKWLYWITPHAYSVHDVLREQYGSRAATIIILAVAACLSLVFAVLRYGSHAGW